MGRDRSFGGAARRAGKHESDDPRRGKPMTDAELEKLIRKGVKGDAIKYAPKAALARIRGKIAKEKAAKEAKDKGDGKSSGWSLW